MWFSLNLLDMSLYTLYHKATAKGVTVYKSALELQEQKIDHIEIYFSKSFQIVTFCERWNLENP